MRFLKMPPQVNRLVVLVFVIVVTYLLARALLTPASFGGTGFYREAALVERAALPQVYAGKVACAKRYPEQGKALESGGHKSLSCEACHGSMSQELLNDPKAKPQKPAAGLCLRCHETNPSRPASFRQIDPKDHYEGECLECHLPHQPNEAPEEEPADAAKEGPKGDAKEGQDTKEAPKETPDE